MQITKRKLFKSTVAKVMAVTMAVTMLPVPANANTDTENTTTTENTEENGSTTDNSENTEGAEAAVTLPPAGEDGTITLEGNVNLAQSESFTKDATIDLNGKTITLAAGNVGISTTAELTIKDDTGKGSIVKAETNNISDDFLTVSDGGSIIIESGNFVNDYGYGIYANNGGSVYVNGGTISSKSSTLTGNNTTGDMNLYISGGTLTTQRGPCIYMPSNLNLYIGKTAVQESNADREAVTGSGTEEPELNGGVSVRMGTIKISGGTFNAMTEDGEYKIDSPAVEYNNQNVWFPDAFWVMGGTYKSSSGEGSENTNALNLDIENGIFNCDNGKGSAIAIYDFGLLEQNMTINILGGTFNKTGDVTDYDSGIKDDASRENRTSFDVLTLDNIFGGNSGYDQAYNKDSVIEYNHNNRKINISGGIFTKTGESFPSSDEIEIDGGSCLKKGEGTSVTVATHSPGAIPFKFKEASLSEAGTYIPGNIAYSKCGNCDKAYIKTSDEGDGKFTEINEEDAKLYLLELAAAEGNNINVSFDDTVSEPAKLTESYGMYYKDANFIVTPKAGYEIKTAPTFALSDNTSSDITDGKGIIKVQGDFETDGIKYTGTITTGSAFATSEDKNCKVIVSAETTAIPYKVSYSDKDNAATVANATVTVKKNNEDFVIDDKSTAIISDTITITITPNAGYTLTETSLPNATVENGSCTITYTGITKDLVIDLSGVKSEEVTYKVTLPTPLVTAAKNQHVTASLDNTGVSALTPETVLRLVPDKGYEIVSAKVTTAENTCVISNMEDDKTDSRTKLIKLSNITGDTAINSLEVVTKKSEYKLSYDTSGLLNATAVSKSGKLEDIILNFDSTDTLTITPEKGYTLTDGISVKPVTEGACTVTKETASSVESQVYKTSGLSGDCQVKVSGEAAPIEYTVSLDKTKLAGATVTLKKDDKDFTTGGTANINSRLEVIITPEEGKAFKGIPVAEIEKNTDGKTNAAIGTAIASNGSYTYTVYNFTGNTKIIVSGTTEATSHSITMPSDEELNKTLENVKASLDFTKVADNGSAIITITPAAIGYQITSDIVLDKTGECTVSPAKASANGTFTITLSDIKSDIIIKSITAKAEEVTFFEAGTDIATNVGGANLGDTFDLTGKTEEEKEEIKNKQNEIIEAVKDTIGEATTSSVIFTGDTGINEDEKKALVEKFKEAVKDRESKIALSLEVKVKEPDSSETTSINNKKEEVKSKHTPATGNKVTISEPYTLDITLFAKVVNNNSKYAGIDSLKTKIENAGNEVTITMKVPSSIPPVSTVKNFVRRIYHVLRLHKGVKEAREAEDSIQTTVLDCGYDEATDTISFKSDKFSTYVLQYTDETKKPDTPTDTPTQTPDSSKTPSLPNYIPSGIGGGSMTTPSPSASPSATPGTEPTKEPGASLAPSITPGTEPTVKPGTEPTKAPGTQPTKTPGTEPTKAPGTEPTKKPSAVQTGKKVTVNGVKCTVTSTGSTKTVKATGSKNAKSVVIPANVKIGGKAYKVTAIANNAFKNNVKLKKLTIGANVKKIGKNAFKGCKNLKKITIKTKKLTKGTVGKNAFKGINKKAVVKVPKGKVKSYKKIIKARGAKKSVKVK